MKLQIPSTKLQRISKLQICKRCLLLALAMGVAGWLGIFLVPLPKAMFERDLRQMELVDRNGLSLRTVRNGDEAFRRRVGYEEIPQALIQATLAAEDRRYWEHGGVDWHASLRAAIQLLWNGRIISGGSTISQQLIKLAQPRPRTFRTKLIEAAQATRLEQVWNKQRILGEYLNRLEYGNFNSGCSAAAQSFFGKRLSDLSVAECALLAGLPQSPSRLNPRKHLAEARRRQEWVLGEMLRAGWLNDDEFARAWKEPLRLTKGRREFEAPHFVDLVLEEKEKLECSSTSPRPSPPRRGRIVSSWFEKTKFPAMQCNSRKIQTTLDLQLNRAVELALRQHLAELKAERVGNGAAVVIDNRTGEVLALVGSENYFAPEAGQVNGAWAARSAGSTFKPFTYLLALERGATPASIVADVPTDFATETGIFTPVNYDRHCYGPMRYRLALANSLNISAVKVLESIGGAGPLQERLQHWGLSTLTNAAEFYGLGLTIGNAEARLLELANCYACLARLGKYKPYQLIAGANFKTTQITDQGAAYLIADILSDNEARTMAFGAESSLRFDFPVACKTGTSSDFRDNWAFGYTPEFTVGVWVGNFDGSPMAHVSGVTGAGPIMHEVMEMLHARWGTSWYLPPSNLVKCLIDPVTGKKGGKMMEKFIVPPPSLAVEDYDSAGRVRLGPEYRDWLKSEDTWLGDRAVSVEGSAALRITFPLPGTTVYLDPDLPASGRKIVLKAQGGSELRWRCESLEFSNANVAVLVEGRHRLTVTDGTGREAETWLEVVRR